MLLKTMSALGAGTRAKNAMHARDFKSSRPWLLAHPGFADEGEQRDAQGAEEDARWLGSSGRLSCAVDFKLKIIGAS